MTDGSGKLPPSWHEAPVGEVLDVLDRFRVPVNDSERAKRPGPIPYYGATGQVGWINDHLFDEELILLGEDGAPFLDTFKPKAYLIKGKSWVNNHAHVLRARAGCSNGFLLYQMNAVDYGPFVSGTTRLKLPQGPMVTIPLRIAPSNEQRRIVAAIEEHFTRLDSAVAALRRVRANLKRYRASVLKAACEGRLVPTEADLARAERREYEPASALLERVTGKASPNGTDLREGWAWATVQRASTRVDYGTSARTSVDAEGVPVLRMGNIVDGRLSLDALKFLPANHDDLPATFLEPGDILFNRTNSPELVGKAAVYGGVPKLCSFASYLIRVRLNEACVPEYLNAYINSAMGRAWVKTVVSQQVGQANVNGTKLKALPIMLPPLAEQQRIVAEVERRLSVVDEVEVAVEQQLRRAERLRQAILKRAFAGKLVPQDPNDEPASVLLERIRAERRAQPQAERPRRGRAGAQQTLPLPGLAGQSTARGHTRRA